MKPLKLNTTETNTVHSPEPVGDASPESLARTSRSARTERLSLQADRGPSDPAFHEEVDEMQQRTSAATGRCQRPGAQVAERLGVESWILDSVQIASGRAGRGAPCI